MVGDENGVAAEQRVVEGKGFRCSAADSLNYQAVSS
jgi:hypothetical protein